MIRLPARYPGAPMLGRAGFKKPLEDNNTIPVPEVLYPLPPAWDSVVVNAVVELGGSDQIFNLLVGRQLMKEESLEPQVALTTPLLEGLDAKLVEGKLVGDKMSKSHGNYVGISEPPFDQFRKVMSVSDDLMWRYYD